MNSKSIKDFVSKNISSLAVPIAMIIIGLFFVLFPGSAIGITVKVIGVIFVVIGLVLSGTLIVSYSSVTLVISLTLITLGIICIAASDSVASFVIKVLGIIVLVNSVLRIHDAYEIKGISDRFIQYIVNDLITLILGIVLIVMPLGAAAIFVRIVGIIMIILGVSNIVTAIRIYRDGQYVDDGSDVVWEE
jgi:uncharacterized membrane protein HdeD (DUF308 family)